MAGSWALAASPLRLLPPSRGRRLSRGRRSLDSSSLANPPAHRPKRWTPLDQALDRFRRHEDRFGCERRFRALRPSLERLATSLRAGGASLENLLSAAFSGWPLAPQHEAVLREDELRFSRDPLDMG